MNIPSSITADSLPLLWKDVLKEGKKTKKVVRINKAITIFSQIFFAIAMMLIGWVVFYFLFQNDSKALLIQDMGTRLMQFLPSTLPIAVKLVICLLLALIAPAVCCLLVRLIFSLFSADYKNDDMGKNDLAGAEAILEAVEKFKKDQKYTDITWDLPEHWAYNLIFSIAFLSSVIIQLYFLADTTKAEGILSFVLMGALFSGIGGLILLLPIAGLKAISNSLCNLTCVSLKNSKEQELTQVIEALCKYINNAKREIKAKEEAEQKRIEKQRLKEQKEQLLKNLQKGQELYDQAVSTENPDEELMKEAAKLGNPGACYYLGKKLLADWMSDMYTSEEKEEIAEDAAKYFDVARQMATLGGIDAKTECQFLWLFCRVQYESNTKSQWKQLLSDLRDIQSSGELPKEYNELLESAIKSVIRAIDQLDAQPIVQPTPTTEPPATFNYNNEPSGDLSDDEAWHAIASGMMGGGGIDATGM